MPVAAFDIVAKGGDKGRIVDNEGFREGGAALEPKWLSGMFTLCLADVVVAPEPCLPVFSMECDALLRQQEGDGSACRGPAVQVGRSPGLG